MTWPTADVSTTNVDAGGDSAATARTDILDLFQKFNQLRNHVTAFMQTLLTRTDAAGVRTDVGISNHELVTVDASGNMAVPGSITATGNVTAYSDERLKSDWAGLPVDFVDQLASVQAGTFQHKWHPQKRMAGVSAQTLQQLLPEAVEADPAGYLSVAYGNAALVACVALAQEVQHLRAEIRQLKGEP